MLNWVDFHGRNDAPKMYKIWQRILRKMKCRMENQPD
nr:MAG TPA: hypothetical protein [Bacteriophage sp.]